MWWRPRRALLVASLAVGATACVPGAETSAGEASFNDLMSNAGITSTRRRDQAAVLRVAVNRHLHEVLARSSVTLDPAALGDAAVVLITTPTRVLYDDPRNPRLDVTLGTGRFVALDQTAGWIYGLHFTPQPQATPIDDAVAAARAVERSLEATAWRRDPNPPWRATADTVALWVRSDAAELPVARFTSGSAEVRVTLKRTGTPTPSERVRGKTAEGFYAEVAVIDLSRLHAYEAHLLRRRRAQGDGATPLPLATFMNDTSPP